MQQGIGLLKYKLHNERLFRVGNLLKQNLSPKDIARSDMMKLKVS